MDDQEARSILRTYRASEPPMNDALSEEALRKAEAEPELGRWWSNEQELDRIIASKLSATHVPAGLPAHVLPKTGTYLHRGRSDWSRNLLLAAASIIALAVLFSSWRGPFQPAASLADYRGEMVSFIKVAPSLELESSDLGRLKNFLAHAEAPAQFTVPGSLQKYVPIGCRVLRFRGADVSLVCFKISGGKIAHLFVTDAKAVRLAGSATAPTFAKEDGWMTATWTENGHAYLFAVKGDQAAAEKLLRST